MQQKDLDALKKPFGTLVPDAQVTKEKISAIVKGANKIIAVGDATTERLLGFGITPDLAIVDGKERRLVRDYPRHDAKEMRCTNPAGAISQAAVDLLKKALAEKTPVIVIVEGEEDMLALPMFVMAPEGAIVLYGQPLEGMVAVSMTAAKRRQAKDLMDRIGVEK
ncbi:MAG: GTP-dependent dephospho-CoA kinase family protein [Nitrososphaera sp.]